MLLLLFLSWNILEGGVGFVDVLLFSSNGLLLIRQRWGLCKDCRWSQTVVVVVFVIVVVVTVAKFPAVVVKRLLFLETGCYQTRWSSSHQTTVELLVDIIVVAVVIVKK